MRLINRNTDYAVRALLYIGQNPERQIAIQELVSRLKMPRAFSRRLLQELAANGVLASLKGKGGGFVLAKPLSKIRILGLMRIFQGELDIAHCFFKKKICTRRQYCPLHRKVKEIEAGMAKELEKISVACLLKES